MFDILRFRGWEMNGYKIKIFIYFKSLFLLVEFLGKEEEFFVVGVLWLLFNYLDCNFLFF